MKEPMSHTTKAILDIMQEQFNMIGSDKNVYSLYDQTMEKLHNMRLSDKENSLDTYAIQYIKKEYNTLLMQKEPKLF